MDSPASRVSRVLVTGPLTPFVDAYRAELQERGYRPLSVVNELRQMARLSRWLEAGGLTVAGVNEACVAEFFEWQRVNWRHRKSWSRPGIARLVGMEVHRVPRLPLSAQTRARSPLPWQAGNSGLSPRSPRDVLRADTRRPDPDRTSLPPLVAARFE